MVFDGSILLFLYSLIPIFQGNTPPFSGAPSHRHTGIPAVGFRAALRAGTGDAGDAFESDGFVVIKQWWLNDYLYRLDIIVVTIIAVMDDYGD